jgi:protein-disulfide isomerase/uncharacterized membrane protein
MAPRRAIVALVLALAGALLSSVLLLEHHGETPGMAAVQAICGQGDGGCDVVARSPYSRVAGVPLAALGIVFYLSLVALLLLTLLAGSTALVAGACGAAYALILALAIDAVLLGIQAFTIKAFCKLCLVTYAVNFAALLVLLPAVRAARGQLGSFFREARLVLAGWAFGTCAVAAAVLAANVALTYRAERRATQLLGDPAATAAPGAASPDTLHGAQEEVRRLRETLDDPQKREQYLTEKALKEFEDAPVASFDLTGPVAGPPSAPIKVLEFSDFLCPFCRSLALAFKDFLPKAGGRVSVYFKNYPLDKTCNPKLQHTVHEGACWLALGAICAQEQGRFWPYHDKVFGSQLTKVGREDAARLGGQAGLDVAALNACLTSTRARDRLSAEIAEAERGGVQATPTLFLNGKRLPRVNDFLLAVEKEAARLGLPAPSGTPAR